MGVTYECKFCGDDESILWWPIFARTAASAARQFAEFAHHERGMREHTASHWDGPYAVVVKDQNGNVSTFEIERHIRPEFIAYLVKEES